MLIQCPHCAHRIEVRNAKPNRYTPKCDKCKQGFILLVKGDPDAEQQMAVFKTREELEKRVAQIKAAKPAEDVDVTVAASRPEAPTPDPDQTIPATESKVSYPVVEKSDPPRTGGQGDSVDPVDEVAPMSPTDEGDTLLSNINDSAVPDAGMGTDSSVDVDETIASDPGIPDVTLASDPGATVASNPDVTAPSGGAGSGGAPTGGGGELRGTLGGYQIERLLGRGGMGSVYLARQLSLDRAVAVKTMNEQWAADPIFLSRFTREAYAAAQLVHHNVVQIYDIGEDKKTHFFSMEFVPGRSLQDLINEKGALDSEEAVGYILQAARGLKFAHDHGMVHRDIKPDNLMLNEEGIVKVADLGLVKTPGAAAAEEEAEAAKDWSGKQRPSSPKSNSAKLSATSGVTVAGAAMGTPAYMAPEQASDAANVDERADIYSLGCTLYTLVTAQHVFKGKTIMEVMSKHATEPVVPPDVVVSRVPKNLSQIVLKMVAKRPHDRYQSIDDLIEALETFLGISSAGPFTPKEQHAALLESAVDTFNKSSKAKLRGLLKLVFTLLCVALVVILPLMGKPIMGGAALGLWLLTSLCYFGLTGITQKTVLFAKVRQLVFGSKLTDWAMWFVGLVGIVLLLWVFKLLWAWIGVCVIAAVIAAGFHFTIDRMVKKDRAVSTQEVQDILKSMRLKGLEEDALRRFVCKYSGKNWELFFETLFGYEAKLAAREKWGKGDDGKPRRRHGVWRDGAIAWIDEKLRAREEAKQAKHLQKIEREKLKAQGMNELQARKEAEWTAVSMVASAAKFQESVKAADRTPEGEALPEGTTQKVDVNRMIYGDENEEGEREIDRPGIMTWLMNLLLGARMRFVVGALLVIACVLWMHKNDLIPGSLKEQTGSVESLKQVNLESIKQIRLGDASEAEPLTIPLAPSIVTELLSSYSAGLAGLVLLASCIFRGKKMTVFMVPAAGIILAGHLIPKVGELSVGPLQGQHLVWAAGGVLVVLGVLFGRRRDD